MIEVLSSGFSFDVFSIARFESQHIHQLSDLQMAYAVTIRSSAVDYSE